MDEWWKAAHARLRGWLARPTAASDRTDGRSRIRFGPDSAVASSAADWVATAGRRPVEPTYHAPTGREGEYERLQDVIARLAHPDELPPPARR
jgi:hypothetical protein